MNTNMPSNKQIIISAFKQANAHPERCYYSAGEYEWDFKPITINISELTKSWDLYYNGEDVYLSDVELNCFKTLMAPVLEKVQELDAKHELKCQKEWDEILKTVSEFELTGEVPQEHLSDVDKYEAEKGRIEININFYNIDMD